VAYGLETIDWSAPWLAPWSGLGQPVAQAVAHGQDCASALNDQAQSLRFEGVRFVPQAELPVGQAYEDFIFRTRQVPTRNGLHDFFNGLCWLHFPAAKSQLNRLQAAQIAHLGVGQVRGLVRDRLTVFDENAILMQAPDAVWDALQNKNWNMVFNVLRPLWCEVNLLIFGHALLEKLTQPRKNITGHVVRVPSSLVQHHEIDQWLVQNLNENTLTTTTFAHLPVLGVPGWCENNKAPSFYDDINVFRSNKNRNLGVQFYESS
jgi:hypothetical protein